MLEVVGGATEEAGGRGEQGHQGAAGQRGHSLTRTRVKRSEGPLDQMIEAMIQPPADQTNRVYIY